MFSQGRLFSRLNVWGALAGFGVALGLTGESWYFRTRREPSQGGGTVVLAEPPSAPESTALKPFIREGNTLERASVLRRWEAALQWGLETNELWGELNDLIAEAPDAKVPELWRRLQQLGQQRDLKWIDQRGFEHRVTSHELHCQLAKRWILIDLRAAMAAVEALPSGRLREQVSEAILEPWMKEDAAAAMNWLRGWAPSDRQTRMLDRYASLWTVLDPSAARAFAATLGDVAQRRSFIAKFAVVWSDPDVTNAQAWVEDWPEEDRRYALVQICRQLARRRNPAAALAAAQIRTSQPEEPGDGNAVLATVSEWASREPAAAAQWFDAAPESVRPAEAVIQIVAHWSNLDLVAAGEWLQTVPVDAARDRAVALYAARLAPDDADAALAWVASITDPGLRETAMETAARQGRAPARTAAQSNTSRR